MIVVEGRIADFVMFLILIGCSLLVIYIAEHYGKYRSIRPILGVARIDEAIGRATEMGRPVHFATGDASNLYTALGPGVIAGLSVLDYVARLCARRGTKLICAVGGTSAAGADEIPLMHEIVKGAYVAEGKESEYTLDMIRYISPEQQGYVAGVIGLFLRERPAANICIGPWAGAAVPIGEYGVRVGALQIGGSTREGMTALFFILYDYALLGTEIYAAGATLSKDPAQIASFTAEDVGKIISIALIIIGSLLITVGNSAIRTILGM